VQLVNPGLRGKWTIIKTYQYGHDDDALNIIVVMMDIRWGLLPLLLSLLTKPISK